ncbi:AdeC/AdeK/OprM family multidrug efflux complex outer membrane factor [Pusillimonas sp. MFBS29]|uniref:AdeC/AdeK/OprM family multidrug efflux complex outer membrane factor n=1 Tax=Pusillimonas sp. MFBS29 TaxID=2886690 RepID=UPI001D128C3B|nr:AdeC/AdeK/OprM family multidrug efflux complex outer membrane factor [Pusillimonas sp. MFBS29]MCC2595539.1 AdeC/AdeK/OprM family multidrug efflux complex outer membrane factor [Pusillimonas sp. MFBS29]
MRFAMITSGVAISVLLQACSMTPKYEQPAQPVETAAWPQGQAYGEAPAQEGRAAADIGWQTFFKDPALKRLIAVALDNNRDLRVAALTVDAYRAQYRIQRSELFPTLDAAGNGSRQRLPADLSPAGVAGISSQYDVGAAMSYELDFFGRVRSLNQQALEEYLATGQAQRSVHISLVADVAQAYLAWQADQALLEVAQRTLQTNEKTLALIQSSFDVGVASALEVRQARTTVDEARAYVQRYTRQVAVDVNGLRMLMGGPLPADMPQGLKLDSQVFAAVPAGLPSDLMQRRPDILAAEHRLIGANANIGAARAAFFPRISLTGAAGTASSQMSGLFEGGSGTWSFMPGISVPIFNAGRLRANLDYAEIQSDIRVAQYEQAIQNAFREVSDSLAARGTYGKQLQAQRELVENTSEYFKLAQQRYDEGVDSYLNVLDAQRLLFTSQQQYIQDRLAQLNSEVDLYKALGGGWLETDAANVVHSG